MNGCGEFVLGGRARLTVALAWLLSMLASPALAQRVAVDDSPGIERARTAIATTRSASALSTPRTVDDLRELQSRIQNAYKIAVSATVGVSSRLGQGSGVIVSKDGLVLTAGHVAREGGFEIVIILPDGRKAKGRVLGINRSADAAMIKILDRGEFPFAPIGTNSELKRGQWTIALGHPGGYHRDRPPVLRLGRIIHLEPKLLVSTNTLVGGDSGGPLFDLDGRVIGIHSRIGESTVANIHVPIGIFLEDWERMARGDVWGALPMPKGTTNLLGVFTDDHKDGAVVRSVIPNSSGAKAGLKPKDVITAVDGLLVRSRQDLVEALSRYRPDDEVFVDILRGGEVKQVRVKLAAGQ